MSQFRVEKRRAEAELTLSSGEALRGWFFLAGSGVTYPGPERTVDLLNSETGFFPFEMSDGTKTLLVNRAHVVLARLLTTADEVRLDAGYEVATSRQIVMRMSTGRSLRGTVRVYRAEGRDRLSDYARSAELFRYLENSDGTYVVNTSYIVDLWEVV